MSWNKFLMGFILVTLLTFAKSQIISYWAPDYWAPLEFSFLLIFFIIRSSSEQRALVLTFFLSLGMDIIFQVGALKGLACMGHLILVYLIMKIKTNVVPAFEDLFLLIFFAVFYVANYFIHVNLSHFVGTDLFTYHTLSIPMLLFLALLHTAVFGVLLAIDLRWLKKGGQS